MGVVAGEAVGAMRQGAQGLGATAGYLTKDRTNPGGPGMPAQGRPYNPGSSGGNASAPGGGTTPTAKPGQQGVTPQGTNNQGLTNNRSPQGGSGSNNPNKPGGSGNSGGSGCNDGGPSGSGGGTTRIR